jgi:hypothetical protein
MTNTAALNTAKTPTPETVQLIIRSLFCVLSLRLFKNTENTFQSADTKLNNTMLMVCARIATMLKVEPRWLLLVAIPIGLFTPKVFVRTAI